MERTLTAKNCPHTLSRLLAAGLFASLAGAVAVAQTSVPPNQVSHFGDTSMLKPPIGAKVAVIEWEDLECPSCAHAFPFVHMAVDHYKIPLVRHDFHIPGHIWSHEGAIYARYLQDKVSPELATEYRREVFASQFKIASREDLQKFTQEFFARNGKQVPFVVDPQGDPEKEIKADDDLALKLNPRMYTPTIIVVSSKAWIEVKDVSDLYQAIDQAEASVTGAPPAHRIVTSK